MAEVSITKSLKKEIFRKFKEESIEIIKHILTLENQPKKGKILSVIGGIVIKELKYKKFRFYFITDGHLIKFGTQDELATILIKFVAMSDKKDQQKIIDEIKNTLKSFGFDSFT